MGKVFAAIAELAAQPLPNLHSLVSEVIRLADKEWDIFLAAATSRIKAIEALQKIVSDHDFSKSHEEDKVQQLLERSPWLIDPTYTQFLTADTERDTMYERLAKEMEISNHAPKGDKERPDLVFFLHNAMLARLVIIELKAPNVKLDITHLNQLKGYMRHAREWLRLHHAPNIEVYGQLIGSMAPVTTKARDVVALRGEIDDAGPQTSWKVRDFIELLNSAENVHRDLIKAKPKASPIGSS